MSDLPGIEYGIHFSGYVLRQIPEGHISATRRDKKQCIQSVRTLISTRPDIDFKRIDDEFILRFLIARKFDVDESFQLYANYYSYKQRNIELFTRFNAQDVLIQQALRDGFPGVLSERDRKGRCVLLLVTSRWNQNCYSITTIYRALLLSLEVLITEQINQLCGFVIVVDWTEFSFRQSSHLNPKILKLMIEGLQDCFPARFKGIHFINQPWYVEAALTVIKPFLKEKTKKKIVLHGNNLSTLHDFVARDILPTELGGEGPPYNPLSWAEKLMSIPIETAPDTDDIHVMKRSDTYPITNYNTKLCDEDTDY